MNKDINIILNSTDVVAGAVTAVDGVISLLKNAGADSVFKFRWAKVQSAPLTLGVDEVAAAPIATAAGSIVAGTEYSFILRQIVGDEVVTEKISYTAHGADGVDEVSAGWRAVLDALAASGKIKATITYAAPAVTISAAAGSPLLTLSNPSNATNVVFSGTTGTAPVNVGADLLSEGVKDSFDAELPTSGVKYTLVNWNLMIPKGYGGFNHQTDDQLVSLKLYVQDDAAAYADLLGPTGDLTYILQGLNPSGTGSDELLGQMPV